MIINTVLRTHDLTHSINRKVFTELKGDEGCFHIHQTQSMIDDLQCSSSTISFAAKKKTGTDPLYVPIETEDVEDAVGIHLDRVQPVHHDNRRISMCAVLARRRGRRSVAWTVASPSTPSHWWTHTTTFVGRGSVAFIVTMVTAS